MCRMAHSYLGPPLCKVLQHSPFPTPFQRFHTMSSVSTGVKHCVCCKYATSPADNYHPSLLVFSGIKILSFSLFFWFSRLKYVENGEFIDGYVFVSWLWALRTNPQKNMRSEASYRGKLGHFVSCDWF